MPKTIEILSPLAPATVTSTIVPPRYTPTTIPPQAAETPGPRETMTTQPEDGASSQGNNNALAPPNFFKKVVSWAKANPFKALIAGVVTVAVLAVIFSKRARQFFGLAKRN